MTLPPCGRGAHRDKVLLAGTPCSLNRHTHCVEKWAPLAFTACKYGARQRSYRRVEFGRAQIRRKYVKSAPRVKSRAKISRVIVFKAFESRRALKFTLKFRVTRPTKISAAMKFKRRADGFTNFTAGSTFACRKTAHTAFGRT